MGKFQISFSLNFSSIFLATKQKISKNKHKPMKKFTWGTWKSELTIEKQVHKTISNTLRSPKEKHGFSFGQKENEVQKKINHPIFTRRANHKKLQQNQMDKVP